MNEWLHANGYAGYEPSCPRSRSGSTPAGRTTTALNNGATLTNATKDPALDALAVYGQVRLRPSAASRPMPGDLRHAWQRGRVDGEGHLRGGSFRDNAAACRAAARLRDQRGKTSPDERFGFRLVLKPLSRDMTETAPSGGEMPRGFPVHTAWCRHRGNFRRDNEDSVWVGRPTRRPPASCPTWEPPSCTRAAPGLLAVVCDGVGGGAAVRWRARSPSGPSSTTSSSPSPAPRR